VHIFNRFVYKLVFSPRHLTETRILNAAKNVVAGNNRVRESRTRPVREQKDWRRRSSLNVINRNPGNYIQIICARYDGIHNIIPSRYNVTEKWWAGGWVVVLNITHGAREKTCRTYYNNENVYWRDVMLVLPYYVYYV